MELIKDLRGARPMSN